MADQILRVALLPSGLDSLREADVVPKESDAINEAAALLGVSVEEFAAAAVCKAAFGVLSARDFGRQWSWNKCVASWSRYFSRRAERISGEGADHE